MSSGGSLVPGPGPSLARRAGPSCWTRCSALGTSSPWTSALAAAGSSTTATTWRMLACPATHTPVRAKTHTQTHTHTLSFSLTHWDRKYTHTHTHTIFVSLCVR